MSCSTSCTRARSRPACSRSAALIGHGRALDVQQRAGEQLFATLTEHLELLYAKSPLAISLNVQEFHPVLNFKKNNLHEHVKKRAKPAGSHS